MNIQKYITENCTSLEGRRIAVTGSCGGIGRPLCRHLAALGADLVLMDRNSARSREHGAALVAEFPHIRVDYIQTELEDISSVARATDELLSLRPYAIIHNAGAYSIPRRKCSTGYDNVFQINFASPYYMTRRLLPHLREVGGRVVAVGSVAHTYSVTDPADVDFSTRKKASLVYGNAKRRLMCSLWDLFRGESEAHLAVTHPGITFTNITSHYPPLIFAIIKHPMKVIFMKPKTASLSLLRGLFEDTGECEWIGPRIFDVWGKPKKSRLTTCPEDERAQISGEAEEMWRRCLAVTGESCETEGL